jgi:hypothetical protein
VEATPSLTKPHKPIKIQIAKGKNTMKKIKLTLASSLVCFLISALLFEGSLWADSKSATYKMTSDLICGTGGESRSAHFITWASAGAQGCPIGSQSSTNFKGFGGWVYTALPDTTVNWFIRGDVNCDRVVGLGDVVYLITFLYKSGPAPCILIAGDVNDNGSVDIGDVVYLITYQYKGGQFPPPCSRKDGGALAQALGLPRDLGHAQVSLVLKAEEARGNAPNLSKVSPESVGEVSEVLVSGKFDRDVAGVHLEIDFNPVEVVMLEPTLTSVTKDLQLFSEIKDGTLKIGIVDLSGKNIISAGEGTLVNLRARGNDLSSIRIRKAILVDADANELTLELSADLKQDVQKTKPQDFSLSQNYPNPFNPQTSIRYALPYEAHVKLVIYNVLGEKVKTLVNERQSAGYKMEWWDGKDDKGGPVASGIYFYRLEADKFSEIKKMMLVK